MILAAEIIDQTVAGWVVGFVMLAITGVLGFLVRNAFDGVSKSIEGFGKKLDDMGVKLERGDGDRRVLEQRVHSLEQTVADVKRELRDLSEGIAK